MHKHAIEDYKNVIDAELTEEDGKITDSIKFEKVYSKQFYSMFEHIAEEFQWRLKDLKSELEKRLDKYGTKMNQTMNQKMNQKTNQKFHLSLKMEDTRQLESTSYMKKVLL